MSSLVSSQPLPRVSIGTCDGGGLTARPKTPWNACDGGGLTARPTMPKGAMSFCGTGDTAPAQTSGISKKAGIIGAAVLLIGGALLGYGHKDQISKGLDAMKGSIDKFFSKGKPAEWLDAGKNLLSKAKDMIFAKG